MAVHKAFYSGRSLSFFYAAHQNEVKLSGFVSDTHTHWSRALEMSRVNRGLNKARNPDYFVRIRHSVSEMGDRLQPLVILRGDKRWRKTKRRESRQGEIKKKRNAHLTYAFNDRLETSGPRIDLSIRSKSLLAVKRIRLYCPEDSTPVAERFGQSDVWRPVNFRFISVS